MEVQVDGWLKALIATTCFAVLGAIGWYGMGEIREAKDLAIEKQSRNRAHAAMQAREVDNCRGMIAAWDSGDDGPALKEFGPARAKEGVDLCRTIVALSPSAP